MSKLGDSIKKVGNILLTIFLLVNALIYFYEWLSSYGMDAITFLLLVGCIALLTIIIVILLEFKEIFK